MQPLANTGNQNVPLRILWNRQGYTGTAKPIVETYKDGVFLEHAITLNGQFIGMLQSMRGEWKMDRSVAPGLVEAIGNYLVMWYE